MGAEAEANGKRRGARGKPVAKRADIWAFGVILYEMLTGRQLFAAGTISDTLAGVLKQEPGWNRVPAKTRRLLQRCLEKDPKRRSATSEMLRCFSKTRPLRLAHPAPWAGKLPQSRSGHPGAHRPKSTQPLVQLDLDLGPAVSLGSSTGPSAILSPDGDRIVFVSWSPQGVRSLFTRRLDQSGPVSSTCMLTPSSDSDRVTQSGIRDSTAAQSQDSSALLFLGAECRIDSPATSPYTVDPRSGDFNGSRLKLFFPLTPALRCDLHLTVTAP